MTKNSCNCVVMVLFFQSALIESLGLGGGFKLCFVLTPIGADFQFDEYFSDGLKAKKLKQQNSWNPTRRCSSLTNNPLGIPPLLGIWRCAELGAYTILVGLIEHPNAQATNLPGGRWDEVGLSDGWITSMRYVWGWMDFWGPIGGTSPIQLLKLGNQPTPLD